jgi:hypothetical protein
MNFKTGVVLQSRAKHSVAVLSEAQQALHCVATWRAANHSKTGVARPCNA